MLKPIMLALLVCGLVAAQTQGPERRVAGTRISSDRDPKVQIQLPKSAIYAGADRWVLYGIADCELHAFADVDKENNVQRLYWIQFEGYIPSKPEMTYQYDSPRHTRIGGLDFYVDTWARSKDAPTRSGSDREHIESLLRAKGYKMPAGMMYVRLVHLLDETKRRELMIVYGEDLAPTGFTAADLSQGGKAYDQFSIIDKGLLERAQQKIAIQDASQ